MQHYTLSSNFHFDYCADGEAILSSPNTDEILVLNSAAAMVVKLIVEESRNVPSDYVKAMKSAYPEVEDSVLRNDCLSLIEQLHTKSVIILSGTAGSC